MPWILAFIFVILVISVLSLIAGYYFYNLSLNPKFDKSIIFGKPSDSSTKSEKEKWFHKACCREESLYSFDKLSLKSYICENPSKSHTWVICVHGYVACASSMSYFGEAFYNMGFNVLLPDARGHGKSQGTYIGMGWHERMDLKAWIDYINKNYDSTRIILFGISMGAATVMMASGEKLPSNVAAIIEDCGYTSVKEEFHYQLKHTFHLPAFPILPAASIIARFKAGYSILLNGSAIKQVKKARIPTLFIHGSKDTFVPFFMLDKLYSAATCPKERLVIDGAGHAECSKVNPELYWSTIKNFINKYVK